MGDYEDAKEFSCFALALLRIKALKDKTIANQVVS
jgi:hypothetical protein